MHSPRLVVWKRAFKHVDGIEYDLDSNLQARQSTPLVERDEAGKVKGAFFHNEDMKRNSSQPPKERGGR